MLLKLARHALANGWFQTSLMLVLAISSSLALGVSQAAARLDPNWQKIDSPNSSAGFMVKVAWVRNLPGRFDYVEGVIQRQPERATLGVDVRLAARSLSMPNPDHATWAQSEEFFDAERHPWIRFVAEGVQENLFTEGGELRGQLTLRGITQEVTLQVDPAECARPGVDCAVAAHGELKRSEFGMQARRFVVADKVRLDLSIRIRDAMDTP